jgi:hypothetical protein
MKKWMSVLLLPLAMTAGSVSADDGVTLEVGAMYLDIDEVDLGSVYTYIGYDIEHGNGYTSTPEILLGYGVIDDTYFADIDAKEMYGINYRGSWALSESVDMFFRVGYNKVKLEASSSRFGVKVDGSESAPGFGLGLAWGGLNLTLMRHTGDLDMNTLSLGWRF